MGKHYGQLGLAERVYRPAQLELGFKAAAIAAGLKRAPSTIGRELRRNGWKRPQRSHAKAERRPLPPGGAAGVPQFVKNRIGSFPRRPLGGIILA
ncbi:MAG: helix-turn-helix domain-containing protein [Terracidiphilus sp.]|jgi:hypothetical protein